MKSKATHTSIWLYVLSALFVLVNAYFIYKNNYYFSLLPAFIAIVYMSFYNLKQLLFFVIFCTPFSLNLESMDIGSSIGFYLPTEPILFGLTIILVLRLLHRRTYDKAILNHPITYAALFYLAWLGITSITSAYPMVSFKFLISKLWFIIPILLFGTILFKEKKNIFLVQWLYIIPLTIVVIITLIRHYGYGFDQEIAHWIMSPFFKDHTSYGAIVAFYIPITIALLFRKENTPIIQFTLLFILTVLTIGLIYSFTRAAWLSLIASLGVYFLFKFKIKFKYVAGVGILALIVGLSFYNEISYALSKNKTDSTKNLGNHIESMSNISTDASNLERINRWDCAVKMFQERPVFGFGGGTYAFEYARFQHSDNLTVISTNFGNKGNAHSEYLGAFAETGLVGGLSFIILLFFVFYRASILYIKLINENLKLILMGIILALTSYFVHGLLNNYLDTDKASIPVWSSIAIIVALDIYHYKPNKKFNEEN